MTERKKTRAEDQAAEAYNLNLAGGIQDERDREEFFACGDDAGREMPDMKDAIRERLGKRKPPHRKYRRWAIAAVIAAGLLLMGFVAVTVYEVVRTDHDEYSEFNIPLAYGENALTYTISLPEGFRCDEVTAKGSVTEARYTNENGVILLFLLMPEESQYLADNETEQEALRLNNGNEAYLFDKDGMITVFWRDKDTFLSITAALDRETMVSIANSAIRQ